MATTLYRQGELAFKQGQYPIALERFQQILDSPDTDPSWRLKGQMGLILTQQKLGQLEQARQGCQRVMASDIPEARRWAASLLAKWPELPSPESPPAPAPSPSNSRPSPNSSTPADPIGFVPLEPAHAASPTTVPDPPLSTSPTTDPIGFTPLVSDSTQAASLGPSPPPPPDSAEPITPASLFHYQHLNQETRDLAPEEAGPPAAAAAAAAAQRPSPAPSKPPTVVKSAPSPAPPVARAPQRRQPIRPLPKPYDLWGAQVITLVAVLWVAITGLHWGLRSLNALVRQVTWPIRLGGFSWMDQAYTIPMIVLMLGLIFASPWWMDLLLAQVYGQRPLTPRQLQSQHPEALKRLRQQCQKQGWSLPELRVLPDPVPLCFSYGWQPRYLRIAVSQGLIESSDDETLGLFLTYELAHMANQATALISGLGGLLLVLHTAYRILSHWADGQPSGFLRILLGLVAQGFYGLFWSLRRGLLWLSRLRSRWADRRLEALLQRPDLQQTSLIWLTQQLPAHANQRQTFSPLWWSLDLLMPLSPQAALSPGSFLPALGEVATVLNDWANPYRQWLLGGASHPPLGDRLRWLNQRAAQRQQPILDLAEPMTAAPPFSIGRLLRQKSPIVGLLAGGGLAFGFWFVGGLVMRFGWQRLSWWYQDESLLYGGILLGLGVGLLLRINALYPDIAANQPIVDNPSFFLGSPDQLPVEGEPCRLSGTLLGPLGIAQGMGQDLYLATLGGIVKIGVSSPNLGLQTLRRGTFPLSGWVGRAVTVSGWRRRSDGVVWIDLETIRLTAQSRVISVATPLWSTLISLGLCLWGIVILWTGG
ncbi:hypothetical protein GFS31_30040 [Leptolyngbya sp. BL0902]|nr:hypothetical protein GFS31_30040 [Leptolyngbya sp. BL0902]